MANRKISAQDIKQRLDLAIRVPCAVRDSGGSFTNDILTPELTVQLNTITALTGGGSNALDGLDSLDLVSLLDTSFPQGFGSPTYGPLFEVNFEESGGSLVKLRYQLVKGTDAESSPKIIRFDDHGSQSQNYVLKLAAPPELLGRPLLEDANDQTKWYELRAAGGGGSTQVSTSAITIS